MKLENNIDFVIPTHHGLAFLVSLLEQTAKDPAWMRHTFWFVFDANAQDQARELQGWLADASDLLLPTVQICFAPPHSAGNTNLLRQAGFEKGRNAFVYFQDDDDPLPNHLERCLEVLEADPDCKAVFGVTETYTPLGQLIERFPQVDETQFSAPQLVKGMRLFPTYGNALSSLFRREAVAAVSIDDGQAYQMCGINSFIVNFFEKHENIQAIPQVVRRERQNPSHAYSPVFGERRRLLLAEDISLWQKYLSSPAVRRFHEGVRQDLTLGIISTYRDITARIEDALESDVFSQEL